MKHLLLIVAACAFLPGCATTTGDSTADARGRATNQALTEASKVLGDVAVQTLLNAGKGEDPNYLSSAAAGLWANLKSVKTLGAVQNVVAAYGGGETPKTAGVVSRILGSVSGISPEKLNAIATVISTAAGYPPK